MDLTAIAGAYDGIKAAKELLTTAFDAKVDSEAKAKIIEAQSMLGATQDTLFKLREQIFALQEERNELKQQLAEAKTWTDQLSAYELVNTNGGAVVFQSKSEPKHYVCPSCVNKKEIHILQTNRTMSGKYRCTGCDNEFPIEPRKELKVNPVPMGSPWSR